MCQRAIMFNCIALYLKSFQAIADERETNKKIFNSFFNGIQDKTLSLRLNCPHNFEPL